MPLDHHSENREERQRRDEAVVPEFARSIGVHRRRVAALDGVRVLPDLLTAHNKRFRVGPDHATDVGLQRHGYANRDRDGSTEDLLAAVGCGQRDSDRLFVWIDGFDPAVEHDLEPTPSLGTGTMEVKRTLYSVTAPGRQSTR